MTLPFLLENVARRTLSVPFVGPETLERRTGQEFAARLGANESLFGPSPKALDAMRTACGEIWKYSDPTNHDLRSAIAAHHGVGIEEIVVGEGIDGLLGNACALTIEPGVRVVMADGAYPTFGFHVDMHGGRLVKVPFRDDREDLDAMLAAVREQDARVLYVSNPNNPMGSWYRRVEIEALMDAVPDTTLLMLDEAYADTAPPDAIPPLTAGRPNVLRFRTFSKAYGLAGARIGYAVGGGAVVAEFDKVRNHYGVNLVGQVGALAALSDQSYLAEAVEKIALGRKRIGAVAEANGLLPLASATNFVTIDCGSDGAFARAVLDGLLARGVFARKPMAAGLDRCIRISVGDDDALDVFEAMLPEALTAARRYGGRV